MDPFIPSPSNPEDQGMKELARLFKENRELKTENTRLKTKLTMSSSVSNSAVPSVEERKPTPSPMPAPEKKTVPRSTNEADAKRQDAVHSATLQKYKTELTELEKKYAISENTLVTVKSHLEQLLLGVCEREEGYNAVYRDIFEELEEKKAVIENLQKQLEKVSEERDRALEDAETVRQEAVHSQTEKARPSKGAPPPRKRTRSVQSGDESTTQSVEAPAYSPSPTGTELSSSARPPRQPSKTAGTSDASGPKNQPRRAELDPYAFTPPRLKDGSDPVILKGVEGAGALRTEREPPTKGRRTKGAPAKPSNKAKPVSSLQHESIKAVFQNVEKPLTTPVAAGESQEFHTVPAEGTEKVSHFSFGHDAASDFIKQASETPKSELHTLEVEFLKHFDGNLTSLVNHVVHYLQSREVQQLDYTGLWNRVEYFVGLKEVVPHLVRALGVAVVSTTTSQEDHADTRQRVISLVLSFRFVLIQMKKNGIEDGVTPLRWTTTTVYDVTVNTLRIICVGRSIETHSDVQHQHAASADQTAHWALERWIMVLSFLCGVDRELSVLFGQFSIREEDRVELPVSLSLYTIRAVVASCVVGAGDSLREPWSSFCSGIGWSERQMPLKRISDTVARMVFHPHEEISGDALLALRLIVIYKGYGYLEHLRKTPPVNVEQSVVDRVFVELFSYAVLDWNLQDPKDDQWHYAAKYFNEYLRVSTLESCNSVKEMVNSASSTNIIVLRALLCLCNVDSPNSFKGVPEKYTYLASICKWIVQHRNACGGDQAKDSNHPLYSTWLGREMLEMAGCVTA